jgi:predicted Zn-dependent protease with MMP-like domain
MSDSSAAKPKWDRLLALAQAEVQAILQSLPAPVRSQALELPIIYERCPSKALRADGIEADTLGLFVGADYGEGANSSPIPPQIILFLNNLWEQAAADEDEFRTEVRTTLLHELGHYLGWDEDDLKKRDLD